MSDARSWGDTSLFVTLGGQDLAAAFALGGKRGLPVTGELMSGDLISYQGGGQKRQPCAQRPQLTHCRAGAQKQGSEPGTPSLWPLRAAGVWGALGTSGHPAKAWTL